MSIDLLGIFSDLISKYTDNSNQQSQYWNEIVRHYTEPKRYYHTLLHLENMLAEFNEVNHLIDKSDTVLFALFYHDIIYDAEKFDNEYQSALVFDKRISTTSFAQIEEGKNMILATKGHTESDDFDTNFFTDIDLAILGQSEKVYGEYCKQIRAEYIMYPDEMYNSGRIKVLKHFLDLDTIYKTSFFQNKYEEKAQQNLMFELEQLN